MGARASVGVANEIQGGGLENFVPGIVCISYPLHKPKDKANLRDGPLLQLHKPSLFISGDEDEMCEESLLEKTLKQVPNSTNVWITGGDHSLKVKSEPEVVTVKRIGSQILEWVRTILDAKEMESKVEKKDKLTTLRKTESEPKSSSNLRKTHKASVELQTDDPSKEKKSKTERQA